MLSLLTFFGKHSAVILAAGVVVAFFLPQLDTYLMPAFPFLVSALLGIAFLRVDVTAVLAQIRRPKLLLIVLLAMFLISPLMMMGIILLTAPPPEIALALMMFACAPPLASTTNISLMIGLDSALCLNTTVIGAILLPFIAPPILILASEFDIQLDAGAIFIKLLYIVGGAIVVGSSLRYALGPDRTQRLGHAFDGVTTFLLLAFLMAVMGPGTKVLLGNPAMALWVCAIALAANFGTNILFSLVSEYMFSGKFAKPGKLAATIGLIGGNRNFALMVPVLPPEIFAGVVVFLAFYQVPIYLTPLLERWVFRELRPV
ncbi:MAG: hypothetical protein COB93_11910 [Sneathiella sp.]|nr:MAG: hypothetical protein COB93_11910 [Sneathiella sp.]